MAAPLIKTKTPGIFKRGEPLRVQLPGERQAAMGVLPHARRGASREGCAWRPTSAAASSRSAPASRCTTTCASGSSATRAPAGAATARRRATSTAACSSGTPCATSRPGALTEVTPEHDRRVRRLALRRPRAGEARPSHQGRARPVAGKPAPGPLVAGRDAGAVGQHRAQRSEAAASGAGDRPA